MCNKHPESQAFINEVDKILAELLRSQQFEKFAEKYFPANEMPLIRRFIQTELTALELKNQKEHRE